VPSRRADGEGVVVAVEFEQHLEETRAPRLLLKGLAGGLGEAVLAAQVLACLGGAEP
jgi:hypothetical protein